jgi:hypothetical protein
MARRLLFAGAGLALISFTAPAPVGAQSSGRPDGLVFLPDVPGQWRALTERPEPLGFHISTTPNPSACRHYQGLVRVDDAEGTPFFLVTRSGNTPELDNLPNEEACDDSPGEKRNGNLVVFRMGSRDKHRERLRSNRLRKGVHVDNTAPPAEDVATIYFTVVEGGLVFRGDDDPLLPKVYQHPGGMQVLGKMMVMAAEEPRQAPEFCRICQVVELPECNTICRTYDKAVNPSIVMFFDVSTPEDPAFKSKFFPFDENGDGLPAADGIAVTPLPTKEGEPGPRYLLAVTGSFRPHDPIHFYRSSPHADGLANPALTWERIGQVTDPNNSDDAHQSLHFLREGNIEGNLYIAAARGHAVVGPLFDDRDRLDLYHVACDTKFCEPGEEVHLTVRFNGRRITPRPSTGGSLQASLAAATGFHETPSGELIFYATEHDNDGPSGTVRAGEWRHINLVRDNSPTLQPSAVVNGPYTVDEGSSVSLTGTASPGTTQAAIQFFHKVDFGGVDFATFYPVVDYRDRDLDDFDNFFALELQLFPFFFHSDKARSWKWFAPVGCSIQAQDHHEGTLDEAKTLFGTGGLEGDPDLSIVLNDGGTDDIDQEVDAVKFLEDCDEYYAAPLSLHWDLNGDGSFETSGSPVAINAATLDGPSVIQVAARAEHPTGGPSGPSVTTVTVRNVAPALTPLRLTDIQGNVVNVDVPFVLAGLPVVMSSTFTDPGRPDHQTASLAWGDGRVDAHNTFAFFNEAFGDGTGFAVHARIYPVPGNFPVQLSVSDDDGGTGSQATTLTVRTPLQAVESVIAQLDVLIAATTNPQVRKDLERARKALAGNPNGSNGALEKIRNGQTLAAIAFLNQAIGELQDALQGGANVGKMIGLLQQVIAALVLQH